MDFKKKIIRFTYGHFENNDVNFFTLWVDFHSISSVKTKLKR